MDRTRSGNALFIPLLIVVCIFAAIFSFSLFTQIKSAEDALKQEKEVLSKEKAALAVDVDSLKADVKAKADTIAALQAENKTISDSESLARSSMESLKKDNNKYKDEVETFNSYTPSQLIILISSREKNENARNLLEDTAKKLDMIREGKTVSLEPITVTKNQTKPRPALYGQKQGKVVSVDIRDGTVVIDMGKLDGIKEGQYCTIYDGQSLICAASVAWTRFTISGIITNDFQPGHSIKDVKEGLSVVLE